ncbi:SET domain [Cordyceps militaris]|uniref:SET domain n=1 Tax=Cordyceps militaris TaxID=73501 RepID=A0A2H4SBU4_CORMI|nr:SET domain [Cordyceps militaris]
MRALFLTPTLCALAAAGSDYWRQRDAFAPVVFGPVQAGNELWNSLLPSHESCQAKANDTDPVCVYSSPLFAFDERDLPGRGKGLIANKTLHRGDRIFAHTPILMFHEDASQSLQEDVWAGLEHDAVRSLPLPAKDLFWNLFGQPSYGPAQGRIYTNAFSIEIKDIEHYAIFPEIARLNHDCRPNAAYFFDEATLTHYVHALTDIHPGTELTITYIDPQMSRKERMETLADTWGFTCSCNSCSMAARLSLASDARLAKIEEMTEDFDVEDNIMPSSMALALISLYEQERLYGPVADAYRYAATAFCAEKDRWGAIKYANLAVETGMLEHGFNDLDVKLMEQLATSPETQPCWFHAKDGHTKLE